MCDEIIRKMHNTPSIAGLITVMCVFWVQRRNRSLKSLWLSTCPNGRAYIEIWVLNRVNYKIISKSTLLRVLKKQKKNTTCVQWCEIRNIISQIFQKSEIVKTKLDNNRCTYITNEKWHAECIYPCLHNRNNGVLNKNYVNETSLERIFTLLKEVNVNAARVFTKCCIVMYFIINAL